MILPSNRKIVLILAQLLNCGRLKKESLKLFCILGVCVCGGVEGGQGLYNFRV